MKSSASRSIQVDTSEASVDDAASRARGRTNFGERIRGASQQHRDTALTRAAVSDRRTWTSMLDPRPDCYVGELLASIPRQRIQPRQISARALEREFPPATKTSGHRAGVHRRSAVHFVTAGDGAPPWQRPRARSLSRELLVTGKSWQASATASLRALTSSPRQGPARAGIRVHCSSPPSQRCGARAKQSACHRDRWAFPWTATRS
jgi:hypothetical protein